MFENIRQLDNRSRSYFRQWVGNPAYRRKWRRDQAVIEAAYERFDGMTPAQQVAWLLEFIKDDLPLRRAERAALSYQLRALAQIGGLGWRWRRPLGPLSDRAIKRIQADIRNGIRALQASRAADLVEPIGWQLPPHRVWLRRMPAPSDNPHARTGLHEFYEAADERSSIVVAIGHFLRRHISIWRSCACGCGEPFVASGKQKFLNRKHENGTNQKKWYAKHHERARE